MRLSEVAKRVITLAEAIRNYWADELPKRHPDYPIIHPGEESGPPPPEQKKLQELLAKQPEDIIYQLALIMYLGRGDFDAAGLAAHYKALKETFGKPERAAAQMMEKASLAEYLSDGLEELKKKGIDPDRILAKPARSRK